MRFKKYDALRIFVEVAREGSFSDAALRLIMTKGAISYQIKLLESDLGVHLFIRQPRGVVLTTSGKELLETCKVSFFAIETKIEQFSQPVAETLTVGMSTYFASRWLSPRLTDFMQRHPTIRLRIQPIINLFDLEAQGIDLAIRWGDGNWKDVEIEAFLPCPAWPVGNASAESLVSSVGPKEAFGGFKLLRDHDGSNAWSQWYGVAEIAFDTPADSLIIPDPNVRVQSVIDGQGIALNDVLVEPELRNGSLFRLSQVSLDHYGYFLAYPEGTKSLPAVQAFAEWIKSVS
jgi:DNA-binding transcriptional LysR family regulator